MGRGGSDGVVEILQRLGPLALGLAGEAAAVEDRRLDRRVSGSAGEVGLGLGMALQAGVGGGAVEQRHRLLAAELEGASEVDRSLHVLVAVEMAKAAVGPGGGETGDMVDRGETGRAAWRERGCECV